MSNKTRICVDRRKAVGDVIMITPVLRELRKRYEDALIYVITEEVGVMENNPHIDGVYHPSNMASGAFDIYINLNDAYELHNTENFIDCFLRRAFGNNTENIDKTCILESSEEEKENVKQAIIDINSDYIVFHMRQFAWLNKNIDLSVWYAIMDRVEKEYPNIKMISIGHNYDHRIPQRDIRYIDLNDQLTFGEMKDIISGAKLFMGIDSAPFHIAGTTNTPIIALLNHVTAEQILPFRDNISVVYAEVPCIGCYARQQAPVRNLVCEQAEQWVCNKRFDVDKIMNEIDKILK